MEKKKKRTSSHAERKLSYEGKKGEGVGNKWNPKSRTRERKSKRCYWTGPEENFINFNNRGKRKKLELR